MKGIMILSFHKKPGAFVDREYPAGISKQLGIDDIEQNKIYSLHRMRNTRPNYLFIKAKGVQVASFYSGFDMKQYIGHPNHCVSVILDNNENPTIWEDQLRRLAYELLPKLAEIRGDEIPMSGLSDEPKYLQFDSILAEKFHELEEGKIEPMLPGEGEVLIGTGAVIEKIDGRSAQQRGITNIAKHPSLSKEDIEKAAKLAAASSVADSTNKEKQVTQEPVDPIAAATKQMEEMEKESLRNEIRNLHELLNEKDNRIRALEAQLRERSETGEADEATIAKIKGEYEALLASKEQELDTWRSKVAELNENNFINQDTIRKMTEMTMMQTEEMQNQAQTIIKLRKQIKALEAQQVDAPSLSQDEVQTLRVHLSEVEENLKNALKDLDTKQEQLKKLFMKNKDLESKLERLQGEKENLEKEIQDLKEQNKVLKNNLEELKNIKNTQETDNNTEEESNLLSKISELEKELEETKKQLALATEQLSQAQNALANPVEATCEESNMQSAINTEVAGSSDNSNVRMLESKLADYEKQLESLKKELIDAKKTIKVQRREINNLQKLLGL